MGLLNGILGNHYVKILLAKMLISFVTIDMYFVFLYFLFIFISIYIYTYIYIYIYMCVCVYNSSFFYGFVVSFLSYLSKVKSGMALLFNADFCIRFL